MNQVAGQAIADSPHHQPAQAENRRVDQQPTLSGAALARAQPGQPAQPKQQRPHGNRIPFCAFHAHHHGAERQKEEIQPVAVRRQALVNRDARRIHRASRHKEWVQRVAGGHQVLDQPGQAENRRAKRKPTQVFQQRPAIAPDVPEQRNAGRQPKNPGGVFGAQRQSGEHTCQENITFVIGLFPMLQQNQAGETEQQTEPIHVCVSSRRRQRIAGEQRRQADPGWPGAQARPQIPQQTNGCQRREHPAE